MSDYPQAIIMGPLLRRLAALAPNVDLSVVSFPNFNELLESGAVDLVMTVTGVHVPRGLSIHELFEDDFVCMVRRDHPLIKRELSPRSTWKRGTSWWRRRAPRAAWSTPSSSAAGCRGASPCASRTS